MNIHITWRDKNTRTVKFALWVFPTEYSKLDGFIQFGDHSHWLHYARWLHPVEWWKDWKENR
jgi:hypothetical protein